MLLTRTITKKILEKIVHETFLQFGPLSSSSLLDSLKFLGFYYATNAGISINIEDLKTPDIKKNFLENANQDIIFVSQQWYQGLISDTERFQSIIDTWNMVTESLKNKILDYYQFFDPANNLYIMAFSGARGNMSQVRQLVGMRGLMSDQEGKIIDLPIQTNFREGLSSLDYIISSYGARKGIVDTALKTADSGYLTRRLIYVAQDLVIREFDCHTEKGLIFLAQEKGNWKTMLGRTVLSSKSSFPFINQTIDENFLEELKKEKSFPIAINVRSSLTCQSNNSICQKCYGWDLAQGKLISLGEAVGIIAGQSIGEPGTQLTMRTFHTGGIFTGDTGKQIFAPFSGTLIFPNSLKTIPFRTNRGILVLRLQQESTLILKNWKGEEKNIFLDLGSCLYFSNHSFVRKGQVIAESTNQSFNIGRRRLKPIYTSLTGEIKYENIIVRKILHDNRLLKINQDDGVIWITAGKIFSLPKEVLFYFSKELKKTKVLGVIKIVTPFNGIINILGNKITLINQQKKITLDLDSVFLKIPNCDIKISTIIKNYQYVDAYTVIAYLQIFPLEEGNIYSIRVKESDHINSFLFITENDIWKLFSDQIETTILTDEKKPYIRPGTFFDLTQKFNKSGFFLKKEGCQYIFQNALPIFLTQGTILNYKQGDFVLEKSLFATLRITTQQTEDIVQGLPKIEELIEARRPKKKAELSKRPGIFLELPEEFSIKAQLRNGIFNCFLQNFSVLKESKIGKQKKKKIYLAQSFFLKEGILFSNNKFFKITPLRFLSDSFYKLVEKNPPLKTKKVFVLERRDGRTHYGKLNIGTEKQQFLIFHNKEKFSYWEETKLPSFFYCKQNFFNSIPCLEKKDLQYVSYKNIKGDYLLREKDGSYIFLESIVPFQEYQLSLTSTVLSKPSNFLDLGEPLTEGVLDAHDLLDIFFQYHSIYDGNFEGVYRSLTKFQLVFVNSIQSIYHSQGVTISNKHIEIIIRQMTSKVLILKGGDTPFLPGEILRLSLLAEISSSLQEDKVALRSPIYEPTFISSTNSSLTKDGFLSAAGFQETKRVLTKAALEGSSDWLRGLKECIILGRLIPAGSAFLNYKNYLDSVYLFKDKKVTNGRTS